MTPEKPWQPASLCCEASKTRLLIYPIRASFFMASPSFAAKTCWVFAKVRLSLLQTPVDFPAKSSWHCSMLPLGYQFSCTKPLDQLKQAFYRVERPTTTTFVALPSAASSISTSTSLLVSLPTNHLLIRRMNSIVSCMASFDNLCATLSILTTVTS